MNDLKGYIAHLESKRVTLQNSGFEVPDDYLNANLFPNQRFVVQTVLSPFAGIGSEIYQAVKMNRKGLGFELKKSYFDVAKKNVQSAEIGKDQLVLF